MRTVLNFAATAGAAAAFTGCGAGGSHGKLAVVAAENVYGDIAAQIGGPYVHVTSILANPDADPHLFTPQSSTGLAVARARIVVRNGLGYDAFVDKLVTAAHARHQVVISAGTGQANPHVWYDTRVVRRVAAAITAALVEAEPRHARAFHERERRFARAVERVASAERQLRAVHAGAPVAYTEPVPGYLVDAAGLRNLAPTTFTHPIEQGSEPSPDAVATMLQLVRDRQVRVLLYNSQAVSPITARVRSAARSAGVAVVPVTETLPSGLTWQAWQLREVHAVAEALATSAGGK